LKTTTCSNLAPFWAKHAYIRRANSRLISSARLSMSESAVPTLQIGTNQLTPFSKKWKFETT
jgi:hypothetical protein